VAGTSLLSTLSHTPLSATPLSMIPRSALIFSAGSGRIRKGFGGCGEKNRASGGGPDEKEEAGRIFPVPPLVLFLTNSPTSCAFDPAPPGPFAYSPGFGGPSPLSPFHSPPSLIDLARWMLHCPLRPLTVCPTHSPTFEPITAGCPTYPHPPDALPCLSCLQLSS